MAISSLLLLFSVYFKEGKAAKKYSSLSRLLFSETCTIVRLFFCMIGTSYTVALHDEVVLGFRCVWVWVLL